MAKFATNFRTELIPKDEKEMKNIEGINPKKWIVHTDVMLIGRGANLNLLIRLPSGKIFYKAIRRILSSVAKYVHVIHILELAYILVAKEVSFHNGS